MLSVAYFFFCVRITVQSEELEAKLHSIDGRKSSKKVSEPTHVTYELALVIERLTLVELIP